MPIDPAFTRQADRIRPVARPTDPPAPWRRVGAVARELVTGKKLELALADLAAAEQLEGVAR